MEFKAINPAKQALSILEEFKAFVLKGKVVDLAFGVIIGGAFGNIVNSLVQNVLMPLIGVVLPSEHGYDRWVLVMRGKSIPYGRFIGDLVTFLVVAMALYLFIVKFLGWIMKFRAQQEAVPPLTKDQVLLSEIRDLLKEGSRPAV